MVSPVRMMSSMTSTCLPVMSRSRSLVMKSLSPHLAYQIGGIQSCIAVNAERPNDSRHSDGMRQ